MLKHLDGVCHLYIHADADPQMAVALSLNAKTHRYGTCNTMETLLVDGAVSAMLPAIAEPLLAKGVELRGCAKTTEILGDNCSAASASDWDEEYLAPVLAIKVVDGVEEAMTHIASTDPVTPTALSRIAIRLRCISSGQWTPAPLWSTPRRASLTDLSTGWAPKLVSRPTNFMPGPCWSRRIDQSKICSSG